MRVTTNSYSENLLNHLQRITRQQVSFQGQVSTGQRVQSAADDPLAAGQVLTLRDHVATAAQYEKNVLTHTEFAQATHGVMKGLKTILDRAQEIAVRADDLDSAGDLRSAAVEVGQLIEQAVQVANTMHRGEYLLAGTNSATQPFVMTTDGEGRVTGVTFAGSTSVNESEIARGVSISSRVTGANGSGTGERGLISDSRYGADLFAHLIELQNHLLAGDAEAIATTVRPNLANDEENLLYHLGDNASLQARLEATLKSTRAEQTAVQGEISRIADVDLAETIIRLNQTQTNYQAALQSAGSVMGLTLLDFLR